ncbi:hypothetical protein RPB_2890 [Rhodopseudomonas palustris HaA2]|uniref:Uncharacterized protein n=1 Tax=Rhodopseudomonas palustris (strain HaA2) TaxID=316058 RepID=Q2IW18_RHOP2|nr:hypothetical protein [Rhodopseudomonas palustris]ABD07592.1 hypothetical protein RPB_2890 [Rhodopseudomonas palustris HaA2]
MITLKFLSGCFVAALAAQLALWPTAAAAQPAGHGISEAQAEISFREAVDDFISKQVVTNDYSRVRVRLYNLVRVYNPKIGWIAIAEFDGAVVPNKWMPGETQKYYHGIIKIAADKSGMPQAPVINEGQGLWESEAKVANLYKELQEDVGQWKDWVGDRMAPRAPSSTATVVPNVTGPQFPLPVGPPSTKPNTGDPAIRQKYAEMNALKTKCFDRNNPNRQKDCADYQKLYQELTGQIANIPF